jgi:hypothetical protein
MANADTVTMSATLKVDGAVTQELTLSPLGVNYNDDLTKPFVIKYEGNFYGSDTSVCDGVNYFVGMDIRFNVTKNGDTTPFTVGKEVTDAYKGENYVRIKCGNESKFYNVSESLALNKKGIKLEDISLSNVNSDDEANEQLRDTELTEQKTNNNSIVSNSFGKYKEQLQNNQQNGQFYGVVPNNDNMVTLISNQITTEEEAKRLAAENRAKKNRAEEEAKSLANNKDTEQIGNYILGKGGKLSRKASRKAYLKSGRKASRKASRTAYRKLGRKSVANKKRNRGTRKK